MNIEETRVAGVFPAFVRAVQKFATLFSTLIAGWIGTAHETRTAAKNLRSAGRHVAQAIEGALQDVRRGHLVDDFGAALARGIRFEQRARHGGRRKPFVPEHDRHVVQRDEVAGEGARGLRRRSLASVHVQRQADDQSADAVRLDETMKLRRIRRELAALQRLERRGDGQKRVGERKPDGLLAEIESDQAAARRKQRLQLGKIENRHLALADLDAVAGGIAEEETLQAFRFAFFFDGRATGYGRGACRGKIGHEETDMALALRPGLGIDPDVKLQAAHLEPRAAARAQFFGFGDFGEPQDVAIEIETFGFERPGNAQLDMVDTGDAERHFALILPRSWPRSWFACQLGPRLLAKPGILTTVKCTMSVDKDTVRRIAKLARIALDEERVEPMMNELNQIFAWVEQLGEVDVAGVPPMTSVVEQRLRMRDDAVTAGGDAEAITANAPLSEDHFFVVPKVVE